ncbi:hypothetical protein PSM7751_00821 [Pseudooceanicola marinus]|uniref:Uncharacterized protein n=1 Tax=Pseudooceanicola marinus TaxID=396013 RepID=A0A1X6YKX4_9RHOB|nr:hypothetical protein [Pseudooceanicola marinus]SLN24367.1 hypothetical protein PSM7751_00821 [Pseudooceanicola marinus]
MRKGFRTAAMALVLAGGILPGVGALAQGAAVQPPAPTPLARLTDLLPAPALPAACCKVCRKGKACGDSCISRSYSCHKGPGCACDG